MEPWLRAALDRGGIETDINARWENGHDHHPKSVELFESMIAIDRVHNGSSLDIEIGGDGDYGEMLMFLADIYFEAQDGRRGIK